MNGHHHPDRHGETCWCGRRARWHVDCAIHGCANLCGIHARTIQRKSMFSAVFGSPIIVAKVTS